MRTNALRFAALLGFVLILLEGTAWLAGRMLAAQGFLFVPQDSGGFDAYLARRDPLLGWPAPDTFGAGELDPSGARISARFPDPATPACVETFGDSFTYGDEVAPADAWPERLAERLGCRVANYGVIGYGTDQAYLRFRHGARARARLVVLGHFAENAVRNVNRFRGFLSNERFGLKPRFVLRGDALELVPLPELSADEYASLWSRPELLPDDYFFPGGPAGVPVLRFPHLLAVPRVLGHVRFGARDPRHPWYAPFYAPDHPSRALDVTRAILVEFVAAARASGAEPVIALLPGEADLAALRAGEPASFAPLEAALRDAGIGLPPIGARLLEKLGEREPCALYQRCGGAHYTVEGYAEVAAALADWLRERSLAPSPEEISRPQLPAQPAAPASPS